tara:strand:+ start:618 stop:1079 length:462 start_codon:yes stop_codon:yes gene_type:complete
MKNSNILQIKLSNGDELLCDMIELPEEEYEDEFEVIVKNAFMIVKQELSGNKTLGMLRPWMSFTDDTQLNLVSLNCQHIMARTIPSEDLMSQYDAAVEILKESRENIKSEEIDVKLDATTWMERLGMSHVDLKSDSDSTVVNFPRGNTIPPLH